MSVCHCCPRNDECNDCSGCRPFVELWIDAIAARNVAWARWKDAQAMLSIYRDELGFGDVSDVIRQVNETGAAYERATYRLSRARFMWQSAAQKVAA